MESTLLERFDGPSSPPYHEGYFQVVKGKQLSLDVIRHAASSDKGVHVWWFPTHEAALEAYRKRIFH